MRGLLAPDHVTIDIDDLRRGEPVDPFEALVDNKPALGSWAVGPWTLSERVARSPKAWIRRRLIAKLREAVTGAGGVWIRLAPFPYPYRSAFSFRADLDEPGPEDYHRFAAARAPLDGCCTHFLSTNAYLHHPIGSCRPTSARHPVARAFPPRLPRSRGQSGQPGTCPPNSLELGIRAGGVRGPARPLAPSLDDQLEDLGYLYSSDFQLGYDDFPFYPWKGDRFSRILQVPVHPVCEGLFLEAGVCDPGIIADYFRQVVGAKLDAGELAVIYGHPERRLGRMPEVMTALARAIDGQLLGVARDVLRSGAVVALARSSAGGWCSPVMMTAWRSSSTSGTPKYELALEIHRGRFHCSVPVTGPRMSLGLAGLVYERSEPSAGCARAPDDRPRDSELETGHADRARLGDGDAAG